MTGAHVTLQKETPTFKAQWSWQGVAAAVGLGAFLTYLMVADLHRVGTAKMSDFRAFYGAAKAMVSGGDLYEPSEGRCYVYPPLLAFLYSPIGKMSQAHAGYVVVVVTTLAMALALLAGAKTMLERLEKPVQLDTICCVAFLAAFLTADKIKGELQMLQTDVYLLLMLILALRWMDRNPIFAGAALGLVINIKYLPIVMLPYLLVRRRWKASGALVFSTLLFALLPAMLRGWDRNLTDLKSATAGLVRSAGIHVEGGGLARVHHVTDDLSVSITSMAARVPGVGGKLILIGVLGAVVLGIVLAYRKNKFPLLAWPSASRQLEQPWRRLVAMEWCIFIALALIFGPDTNTRHLVLALPMNLLAGALLLFPRTRWPSMLLAAGTVLLFLGMILPPGHRTETSSSDAVRVWFAMAGPTWCMLVMAGTVLWAGMREVKNDERDLTERVMALSERGGDASQPG